MKNPTLNELRLIQEEETLKTTKICLEKSY